MDETTELEQRDAFGLTVRQRGLALMYDWRWLYPDAVPQPTIDAARP